MSPFSWNILINGDIFWDTLYLQHHSIFGTPCSNDVQDMVNVVDMDGTGDISFPEFLRIMEMKTDQENLEMQIAEAFRTFDQVSYIEILMNLKS